jgi:hypothetical protein
MSEAGGNPAGAEEKGRLPSEPRRPNVFFPVLAAVGGLFVVTILAMLAASAGDPQAPPSRFFESYGTPLILAETVLLVTVAVAALTIDRRQTLAERSSAEGSGPRREGSPDDSPFPPAVPDHPASQRSAGGARPD